MKMEKEYAGLFELIAWLDRYKAEILAQQVHQPELTLVPETVQQESLMRDKAPTFRKLDRSAPNAGKLWNLEDTRIAWFAYNGGCKEKEIAEYLDRTENSVHQHIQKIKKGFVKLVANES